MLTVTVEICEEKFDKIIYVQGIRPFVSSLRDSFAKYLKLLLYTVRAFLLYTDRGSGRKRSVRWRDVRGEPLRGGVSLRDKQVMVVNIWIDRSQGL